MISSVLCTEDLEISLDLQEVLKCLYMDNKANSCLRLKIVACMLVNSGSVICGTETCCNVFFMFSCRYSVSDHHRMGCREAVQRKRTVSALLF